jgi:SAM-dependent methyltransferase
MAEELAERLAFVSRSFEKALVIGPIAALADNILGGRDVALACDVMMDEEAMPYPPASFDLIISAGTLDSVNDLPGALVQIRRTLKPDGLFLGTVFGAGTLATLRAAMLQADDAKVRPHIHPQIDLRAMSDLLTRTGFALPVADMDRLEVRYHDWRTLVADLRDAGVGNAMAGPRGFARDLPTKLDAAWFELADVDQKVSESFNFLQLTGWAPSPSQPKAAPRGSATVSLVDVFRKQNS